MRVKSANQDWFSHSYYVILLPNGSVQSAIFTCLIREICTLEYTTIFGRRGAASIVFAIMATVDDAYTSIDLFHIFWIKICL